ncbi:MULTISPECIES: hypothetical protein [unclassified Rathayibacter]|uniref:hypothetical protein n=1 Tax=unclassified Rathayibacter TaxID=2609250 RepID=UPI0013201116|nr:MULTISPECIES: hypothetical protein [unclassified Rathayibacter]QHC70980.1 hypothetical protein GSU45_11770 [Rathayibacter sp. VKM Ac-2801]QHC74310.1 hypothetical protein GSU40_11845 [Rathayibacter sp. VKM Ac-2805]
MITTAAVVGGLLVGLLFGRARTPRFRGGLHLLAAAALAVLVLSLAVQRDAFANSWLAGSSALLASAGHTAAVCRRWLPELGIPFLGWMWRAVLHPRYVRDLLEQAECGEGIPERHRRR